MPTRRAVIDIGTNSVRLVVADVDSGANGVELVPVWRELAMPRLGRGVDKERRLSDAAMSATLAAIHRLAASARRHGAAGITVVGTSALRDAVNKESFISLVRRQAGLDVQVLSGREEAELAFLGAVRGTWPVMPQRPGTSRGAQEVIVVDVGGGSTELVRGSTDGVMDTALSVDVGAVRMTEMCVRSDPISAADWARLVAAVQERLAPLWLALSDERTKPALRVGETFDHIQGMVYLIALGGTATTLAAAHQKLQTYDPALVHGCTLSRADVGDLIEDLKAVTVSERRTLPGVHPERADIILAGAVIIHQVMVGIGTEYMTVSESDLLDGVLLRRHGGDS